MKIRHEATLEIKSDTTVEELRAALNAAEVPGSAKIGIDHYPGDPRDPSYTRLTFGWENAG